MDTLNICKLHASIQFYYVDCLLARGLLANTFKMFIWQRFILTACMAEELSALVYISNWGCSQCYQRCVAVFCF